MKRRQPIRRNYSGALHSDSGIQLTVKQLLVAVFVLLGAGAGYGSIVWTQSIQSSDIKAIKSDSQEQETRREKMAREFFQMAKEQDERRAALGREFLASNRDIADKVANMKTALEVQQHQTKATSEALAKISDQLGTLVRQIPHRPGP